MTDAPDYGLQDALTTLVSGDVVTRLRDVIVEVRRRNADRFEPGLGDDAVSAGFTTWRNITNIAEQALADIPGVVVARPANSFHLGYGAYTISVYGLKTPEPMAASWTSSGVKMRFAEGNSLLAGELGHLHPTLDDALAEQDDPGHAPRLRPTHLVFIHWADADAGTIRIWAGFPRNNERGGPPWLELAELTDLDGTTDRVPVTDATSAAPGFREQPTPEIEVTWAGDRAVEPTEGSGA